jgi:predicted ferric reductase
MTAPRAHRPDHAATPDDSLPADAIALVLVAALAGAAAAAVVLPALLPGYVASTGGAAPKVYWYLSRASGLVAFVLVWLATVLGLLITNRWARLWPGGPAAFDLHQHTSLLGIGFGLFHALILLGDRYSDYSLTALLVPLATRGYRPLWVGLGQVGLYLLLVVGLSFYVRRAIGRAAWRAIHFASFAAFALALAHGLLSGTDAANPWVQRLSWAAAAGVVYLTGYRVLIVGVPDPHEAAPGPGAVGRGVAG